MYCIYCRGDTKVTNSRPQKRTNTIWRRRSCLECQAVFSTQESADLAQSLRYASSDGTLSPFLRDHLLTSVYESLKHRKSALTDAAALTDTIISELMKQSETSIIKRSAVIDQTAVVLARFDAAAHTHYRAFHGSN